jgi:hypothetical protein
VVSWLVGFVGFDDGLQLRRVVVPRILKRVRRLRRRGVLFEERGRRELVVGLRRQRWTPRGPRRKERARLRQESVELARVDLHGRRAEIHLVLSRDE